jgi:hypothetical protein
MSLAMYAAPFDDDYNNYNKSSDNNYINNKKKQIHNKTQKRPIKENFDQQKVNNVLQKIHNSTDEEEEDNLGDFNPPPKPESIGVSKTNATENMQTMNSEKMLKELESNVPLPVYNDESELELNNFNSNYGDNLTTEEYYKKMIPMYQNQKQFQNKSLQNRQYYNNYTQGQVNYSNNNNNFMESSSNDILIQKLNYMINLLEEQQDEKTNNVTEEVVLYSFLGIFIIFVVDSFARSGKYKR